MDRLKFSEYKWPLMVGLANLVHLPCLFFYFFMDDFWHLNSIASGESFFRIWRQTRADMVYYWNMSEQLIPSLAGYKGLLYYFRPVLNLSMQVDYTLFGFSPFGFHLHSLLLHLANAFLLYAILRRFSVSRAASGIGSIVFSIHPWAVEPVDWISARCDLLLAFFMLLAMHSYLNWRRTGHGFWLLAQLVAFVLAMASKESAIIYPALLFALHWRYRELSGGLKNLAGWLPAAVVGVLYFLILMSFMNLDPATSSVNKMNALNLMNSGPLKVLGYNIFSYLLLIFTTMPPFPYMIFEDGIPFAYNIVALAGTGALAFAWFKSRSRVLFFLSWFIAFMLPTMWIPSAGRYLYISALGLCGLLGLGLDRLEYARNWSRRAAGAILTVLIVFWASSGLLASISEMKSHKVLRATVESTAALIKSRPQVEEVYLFNLWPMSVMSERLLARLAGRPELKVRPMSYQSTLNHPDLKDGTARFSMDLWGMKDFWPQVNDLRLEQTGPYEIENKSYPYGFFCGASRFGASRDFIQWPEGKPIRQDWVTAAAYDVNNEGCPQKLFFAFDKKLDDPGVLIIDYAPGAPQPLEISK